MPLSVEIVRDARFLEHKTGVSHPEHPKRLMALYRLLDYEHPTDFLEAAPRSATLEELERVHTPGHVATVLATAHRHFTNLASDTTASACSCAAAWHSAGATLTALEHLVEGRAQAAFAVSRPPGHHALPSQAKGFCIFNNLGVAARHALVRLGLRRILVIDWDVHHGNALQDLFYGEREVFYFSTHELRAFPYTGLLEETGQGPGLGYNLNIPIEPDFGDADCLHLYREVLTAVTERYQPQLIMVAAGFDGHHQDPLGGTMLTEEAFGGLGGLVRALGPERGVPLLLALEGGYNEAALTACVRHLLQALISEETGGRQWTAQSSRAEEMLAEAKAIHAPLGVWAD